MTTTSIISLLPTISVPLPKWLSQTTCSGGVLNTVSRNLKTLSILTTTKFGISTRLIDTGIVRLSSRRSLCLTAWTLTYWIKQNAYLAKILETKPTTFNEIKQAVNSILEFAATSALSKNEKLADGYFKIKSKRLKKKCAA